MVKIEALDIGVILQFPSDAQRIVTLIDEAKIWFKSVKSSKLCNYSRDFVLENCILIPRLVWEVRGKNGALTIDKDALDRFRSRAWRDRQLEAPIPSVDAYSRENELEGYRIDDEAIEILPSEIKYRSEKIGDS